MALSLFSSPVFLVCFRCGLFFFLLLLLPASPSPPAHEAASRCARSVVSCVVSSPLRRRSGARRPPTSIKKERGKKRKSRPRCAMDFFPFFLFRADRTDSKATQKKADAEGRLEKRKRGRLARADDRETTPANNGKGSKERDARADAAARRRLTWPDFPQKGDNGLSLPAPSANYFFLSSNPNLHTVFVRFSAGAKKNGK